MGGLTRVEEARGGGPSTLLGRPSSTRAEWESAREADAADLNRLADSGGEVRAYVVPLWSNADASRCLQELRGFDEAGVYVAPAPGDDAESTLAAAAESGWAGAALLGDDPAVLAPLLYAAAGLELSLLLPDADPETALRALARALDEELSPREIEAVLRGDDAREPSADAREWATELLGADDL